MSPGLTSSGSCGQIPWQDMAFAERKESWVPWQMLDQKMKCPTQRRMALLTGLEGDVTALSKEILCCPEAGVKLHLALWTVTWNPQLQMNWPKQDSSLTYQQTWEGENTYGLSSLSPKLKKVKKGRREQTSHLDLIFLLISKQLVWLGEWRRGALNQS